MNDDTDTINKALHLIGFSTPSLQSTRSSTSDFLCSRCCLRVNGVSPLDEDGAKQYENAIDPANCSRCTLCLGILQPAAGLSPEMLKERVAAALQASGFEFNALSVQVSMPIECQVYEALLACHISKTAAVSPEQELKSRQCLLDEIPAVKLVWMTLVRPWLSKCLQKTILRRQEDCDVNSLIVEVEFLRTQEEVETVSRLRDFLYNLLSEQSGRPRKRRYEFRGKQKKEDDEEIEGNSEEPSTEPFSARQRQHQPEGCYRLGRESVQEALKKCATQRLMDALRFEDANVAGMELNVHGIHRPRSILVGGRYMKFCRRLPQSPWLVEESRRLEDSVEELIARPLLRHYGAVKYTFCSSGREDVDVRMLGRGRPFAMELFNYKRPPVHNEGEHLAQMQSEINHFAEGRLRVRDLQFTSPESLRVIKQGEESKRKHYQALCWCSHPVSQQQWQVFNASHEATDTVGVAILLHQWTPIRVLHRRALLRRQRALYKVCARTVLDEEWAMRTVVGGTDSASMSVAANYFSARGDDLSGREKLYDSPEHLFVLDLTCQAGTYVKEFVHGDLGRTQPNMATLLQSLAEPHSGSGVLSCDILALDVTNIDLDWPPAFPNDDD